MDAQTCLQKLQKVRLNALLPGQTATNFGSEDQQAANVTQGKSQIYAGYAGRSAMAEEMAEPLLFLCSDMASYISGTYIYADYGMSSEIVAGLSANPLGGTIEQTLSKK